MGVVTVSAKTRRVTRNIFEATSKAKALQAHKEMGLSGGIYPLNAPGMPVPGDDFVDHARKLGDQVDIKQKRVKFDDGNTHTVKHLTHGEILENMVRRALRDPGFTMPVESKNNQRKVVPFVPGHIWGEHIQEFVRGEYIDVEGPKPADVMVIGKMPGREEVQHKRCMVGSTGEVLSTMLRDLRFEDVSKWYVTNLLKFPTPDNSGVIKARWLRDCLALLHQELRIVRPRYILCLGSDASKALLGRSYSVSYMDGRVLDFEFPVNIEPGEDEVFHRSQVMTVIHPASIGRSPDAERTLERGLSRFRLLLSGVRFDKEENDIDHRTIRTLDELKSLLYEIDHCPEKTDNVIAVDAEWHGEHPVNEGAYIRTIQLSWLPKHGAAIVLNNTEGRCCFFDEDGNPATSRAVTLLNKFFRNKRAGGHFFVADLEWLSHLGIHELVNAFRTPLHDKAFDEMDKRLQQKYTSLGFSPGESVPAWVRTKFEGGFDTGLRAHAIEETAQLGLEALVTRYTSAPRYDVPLHDWRKSYCQKNNLKAKDLEGYGPCPDEILVPYAIYDADATLRLFYEQDKLLDSDYEGNCCREAAWEAQIVAPPILEMHQTGICVNKQRIDDLTHTFIEARTAIEHKIKSWAKWPDFNIRSVMQVREFLFGENYNGKKDDNGSTVRIRPEGALSLHLDPLMDTSKPPRLWSEVREKGIEHERTPGTSKTILGVLAQENDDVSEQVQWLRDYRFLDQVLKSVLRVPKTDESGDYETIDDAPQSWAEGLVFDAGLASVICDDGRVRTHLYPTTETGRWRSSRPNCQNFSKRRDADYKRMLGDKYKHKLRSVLTAAPGCVLVEADYIGAELFGMAMMAGDSVMIDHARRNQLPDEGFDENGNPQPGGEFPHPDFYDIHSNVAKLAFRLECAPTKAALKAENKSHLRIVAKTVVFGVAYGRGAKAIAFEARQEGIDLSVTEAQGVIDALFNLYPNLPAFFEKCQRRVLNPGWLCNCFGRFRRFPGNLDRNSAGEFERQAQNYPIQSMIASAMNRAVANIQDYRDNVLGQPDLFRMILQIHDAVMLEVPCGNVEQVITEVFPKTMCEQVPVYPTDLDGMPTGDGPYYLGIDTEVCRAWGEDVDREYAELHGLPLKYAAH